MIRRFMPVALNDPIELPCGAPIPNRLVKAAMSEQLAGRDNAPTARHERLYERWGAGGCGLLLTGNVAVDRRQIAEPGNVVIEDRRDLDALRRWAAAGRREGARVWMQINHPGRQANPVAGRSRPVAPSAVPARLPGATRPAALSEAGIAEIVGRFATAAAIAQESGFDGVQLHGAHGYLISQFLSPLSNHRDDRWGGDATRRMRFVVALLEAVREAVGPGFPVGIKLNSADFQRGGFSEAESMAVVERLVAEGIDLVEISGGTFEAPAMVGARADSTRRREAYFLAYAERVRERVGDVPLMVTGGFRSLAAMREAVAGGACDLVGLARPLCLEPAAAAELLRGTRERTEAGTVAVGLRPLVGRFLDLRTADSGLDVQWHTDQIHRLARGREPDLGRGWKRAGAAALRRNGLDALRPRRA